MTIRFRRMRAADFEMIGTWLREPHVQQWWPDPDDVASVEAKYGPTLTGDDPTEMFVIEYNGEPVGLIQRYRLADYPEWAQAIAIAEGAGIDYMIGVGDVTGRGVGTDVIRLFTDEVFADYPDLDVVAAVPQQANTPSWRALEKAGYERVYAGPIASDDPSDAGPAYVYVKRRGDST